MEELKKQKKWVNWKYKVVKGKKTKVPYQVNGHLASSTDSQTWNTYQEVVKKDPKFIGFVLSSEKKTLFVDFDHCLKNGKLDNPFKEQMAEFILESDTYTEISPSGEGLHFYFNLTEPLELVANKHKLDDIISYEAYTDERYFTVTEKSFGKHRPVRTITVEEALRLLEILGYPWKKTKKTEGGVTKTNQQENLTDDAVLRKMFRAKNGDKIKALYEGDTSAYKNDISAADAALCSHLAFWTGKNQAQIERLWLQSPLGQREKTQERKDYRDMTIISAINNCTDIYQSETTKTAQENPDLDLLFVFNKGEKTFVQNVENVCRILRKHQDFTGRFRMDEFTNVAEIKVGDNWRQLKDTDAVDVQAQISILFPIFSKVPKEMVYDAIIKVSIENKIDSAADYLRSLVWDKKSRLNSWLTTVYGAKNDEVTQSIGSNWLKGLVHRIIEPGCKFDHVLVLEGEQGMKKSMSLYILGNGWHVETTMSTDSKDFFMQFAGKAIIEFSEGETLSRTEVKKMKAIITIQSDKYRPPYSRVSIEFPRRCVFAMTTNQTEYLKDETGNRRWLPIRCLKNADVEWLKANRDQLFAEAYYRLVVLKEKTYEFPDEELKREQSLRRIANPWEAPIYEWYLTLDENERNEGITTNDAYLRGVQGSETFKKQITTYESMVVGEILRSSLKLEKRRTMVEGEQLNRYYPTKQTPKQPNKMISLEELTV